MGNVLSINRTESLQRGNDVPLLSILIPFYKDDPRELLSSLMAQITAHSVVEICLYDDGSGDPALEQSVAVDVQRAPGQVKLMSASVNHGRSFARNALKQEALADWVLFLDADMRPVTDHFIADYLSAIQNAQADIIFGGFEVPKTAQNPEQELHRAFSETSDCLTLEARALRGPQYVCSSNLCVHKSVLDAEPFDPEFTGWGWEDSEWAARAGATFTLLHADIPALHLGLETTDTLLTRFKDSGQNYLRFTKKHPELAKTLTLYKAVQKLKRVPAQKIMRPALKALVKFTAAPIHLRLIALKLWRASWYAEVI